MPRVALEPSTALADLLHQRRQEMGLTLREVQARTEALGQPIPFTTLAKVERGVVDPGVRRMLALLRVYEIPAEVAFDVASLEQFAGSVPGDDVASEALAAEGIRHWKAGNLREALAHLHALRMRALRNENQSVDEQRALLEFAVMVASLGRERLAQHIVNDVLVSPPHPSLLVRALVQSATVWARLGAHEAALGFLERARAHVDPENARQKAWVHHERASIFAAMNQIDEAEPELRAAIRHYRSAKDTYGECLAMGLRVKVRNKSGDTAGALDAARKARAHAERHDYKRLAMIRRLDEGRALVALGDVAAGIRAFESSLADAITAEDAALQFFAHHALWKAFETQGDARRAEMELKSAQYFVAFVDQKSPETEEVRNA